MCSGFGDTVRALRRARSGDRSSSGFIPRQGCKSRADIGLTGPRAAPEASVAGNLTRLDSEADPSYPVTGWLHNGGRGDEAVLLRRPGGLSRDLRADAPAAARRA